MNINQKLKSKNYESSPNKDRSKPQNKKQHDNDRM